MPMRDRLRKRPDLSLDRMFETRSEAWEKVGLAVEASQRAIRSARRRSLVLIPLFIAVVVLHDNYQRWFHVSGHRHHSLQTLVTVATVIALLVIGWLVSRDVGRAAAPTFFRRMDPATAGTVGFIIRLASISLTLLIALRVAGLNPQTLGVG